MNSIASIGFVYVATGQGYLAEARRSAESLRFWHPELSICLITDEPPAEAGPFTEIRLAQGTVERRPIDKILAYDAPYEKCLFLDTDTRVLGDLTPIFTLLDKFDLAALQDVNRGWNYELPDVPMPFSEFNTGVLAFRKSDAVQAFFQQWRRDYDRLFQESGFITDQPSFRRALYHSPLRLTPLPSEFHFLSNYPNATLWKVRLLHGRGDMDRIALLANEELGRRAYLPEVGALREFQGRRRWLKDMCRILWRMTCVLFSAPADSSAASPGRWWLEEKSPVPPPPDSPHRG